MTWEPSAHITTLHQRAKFTQQLRQFFVERNYCEVETPALARHTVTDVFIDSFACHNPIDEQKYYLQTSPEFYMKRLLAAGSGPIFQISKAFRLEEAGHNHNPEFTMLEWYNPNYNYHDLMHEVDSLCQQLLQSDPAEKITYHDLFQHHCDINPHTVSLIELRKIAKSHQLDHLANDRDSTLQLIMSYVIEPKLGQKKPIFIYDFPESQAALAALRQDGAYAVAERFEMIYRSKEIANGFQELNCEKQQRERFNQDIIKRQLLKKHQPAIDNKFIQCLNSLPNCAGVALGVDRLFMIKHNIKEIKHAMSFNWDAL